MRMMIAAGTLVAGMFLTAGYVEAAPISVPPLENGIVAVSGGCGPGGFRAENGRCYPRRPPPPRFYGRACPPGMHPTPYGCRRNF